MSTDVAKRPEPGSVAARSQGTYAPHELNAELGQVQIARELVRQMGRPSRITKTFAVRYGIWRSLNHGLDNITGYDCRPRIALYDMVAENSVNEDGWYGEKIFAYLMKPKLVLQGLNMSDEEQEKEGLLSRIGGFFMGRKKDAAGDKGA